MSRFVPAWLATLARPKARRRASRRLSVEQFECRVVPATYTWGETAPGTFNWNDASNWTGGPAGKFPNAVDAVANVTAALVGNEHINLNQAITVGSLTLGSTTTAGGFTVSGNGGTLTFNVSSGSAALTDANTGGDALLAPVVLADNLAVAGNGTAPLVLGVTVSGGGAISTAGTIALASNLTTAAAFPLAGSGTITAAQSMFAESYYDSGLYQFNGTTGALLATLVAPNTSATLQLPAGLTTGPDGNLYISSQNNDTILKYDRTTNTLSTFLDSTTLNAIAATAAGGSNSHFASAGLRFGLDGKLYVSLNGGFTSAQGAVVRFDVNNSGGILTAPGTFTVVASGPSVVQPSGLTFGTAAGDTGNLYFSSAVGAVFKVTGAGGGAPTVSTFVTPNSGGLEFPAGLAFGSDGKLYVADLGAFTGAGKVLRYTAAGAFDSTFVAAGTGAGPGDLAGQFPSDLTFDANGNLLTANLGLNGPTTGHPNDFSGAVYQYTAAGGFVQPLVTSADFPQTGPTASYSGIIPSQLALAAAGVLTVGGNLDPAGAAATGTFTTPGLTFTSGGSLSVTLNGTTPGAEYDRVVATGPVSLGNATLTVTAPFAATSGDPFTILSAPALSGTFNNLPEGGTVIVGSQQFTISYVGGAGHDVVLTKVTAVAPTITSPLAQTFYTGAASGVTLTATGAPVPTFALASGALPPGLMLNSNGSITGTPTATGTFNASITASNASGTDTEAFTFTVQTGTAAAITSAAAVAIDTGTGGTFAVTATGNPAPTLAETATLPTGVTFNASTGVLTVAAGTAVGNYPLAFAATNGVGSAATQNFTLVVGSSPAVTSATTATFFTGLAGTFTVTAAGSPPPALTETGTLPMGVTFNAATGVLSGTPAAGTTGSYAIAFKAVNNFGTALQTFILTVQAGTAPAVTSAASALFGVGKAGTFTVTASGSPAPTLAVTGTLPTGVSFNPATGILAGTPAAGTAGTYPLTVTASNGLVPAATQNFTLTVGTAPAFTSAAKVSFAFGSAGSFNVTTTGSPAPAVAATSTLPAGVTFDTATGQLAVAIGTAAGSYPIAFTAANGVGTATQYFALTIGAGASPAITSGTAALFGVGQAGSFAVTATGTPSPTLSVSGALPTGVTFNPATGLLSGTPSAGTAGAYPLTFTADNGTGTAATQNFTLTVQSGATGTAPAITSGAAMTFTLGQAGSFTFMATGTPAPTLAVTGALPTGVTFDPATNVLSGTPAGGTAGTYPITVTATNTVSTASQNFVLTVQTATGQATTVLPARLSVSGGAGTGVFDANAAGSYATAAASPNPFASLGVTVRTAVADVNGDGVPDTIVVTGPGVPIQFAVVSGKDNTTLLISPTAPFSGSEDFTGGGFVAAADLDHDGRAEVVVTPDQGGGPRVTIFGLPAAGGAPVVKANFLGIDDPNFRGGVRAAVGDVNGDGTPDVAVAAGFLGGPRVALFDGTTVFATPTRLVNDFFAFPGTDAVNLRNGAYVALGDVDGDGFADLIFGGGPGGGPRVFVLSGKLVTTVAPDQFYAAPVANFFVGGDSTSRGGVRVAAVDADQDGRADIVVGSGAGLPAHVRVYLGKNVTTTAEPTAVQDLAVFGGAALADGVYVG